MISVHWIGRMFLMALAVSASSMETPTGSRDDAAFGAVNSVGTEESGGPHDARGLRMHSGDSHGHHDGHEHDSHHDGHSLDKRVEVMEPPRVVRRLIRNYRGKGMMTGSKYGYGYGYSYERFVDETQYGTDRYFADDDWQEETEEGYAGYDFETSGYRYDSDGHSSHGHGHHSNEYTAVDGHEHYASNDEDVALFEETPRVFPRPYFYYGGKAMMMGGMMSGMGGYDYGRTFRGSPYYTADDDFEYDGYGGYAGIGGYPCRVGGKAMAKGGMMMGYRNSFGCGRPDPPEGCCGYEEVCDVFPPILRGKGKAGMMMGASGYYGYGAGAKSCRMVCNTPCEVAPPPALEPVENIDHDHESAGHLHDSSHGHHGHGHTNTHSHNAHGHGMMWNGGGHGHGHMRGGRGHYRS